MWKLGYGWCYESIIFSIRKTHNVEFFYAAMEELVELGVIECANPEVEHNRTEKGERVLGLL